jgi:hypothetical protein
MHVVINKSLDLVLGLGFKLTTSLSKNIIWLFIDKKFIC